ncbi:MAG: nuclear transport factor 2 family protein [Leifsonia sp.]
MTTMQSIDHEIDATEIGWLLTKRASAMVAMDADYLVSRFAPGSSTFDLTPPLNGHGSAATDANGLRDWFAGFEDSIEYAIRDLAITVGGDVAFAHSIERFSARPIGGRRFEIWLRVTTGLRRTGGRWLITHEHRSTPAEPVQLMT